MHVQRDTGNGAPLRRQTPAVGVELFKLFVNVLGDGEALFEPTFLFPRGAHAQKPLLAIQNFYAFAALDDSDLVINGGNTVTKICLGNGDVDVFAGAADTAPAGGRGEKRQDKGKTD